MKRPPFKRLPLVLPVVDESLYNLTFPFYIIRIDMTATAASINILAKILFIKLPFFNIPALPALDILGCNETYRMQRHSK